MLDFWRMKDGLWVWKVNNGDKLFVILLMNGDINEDLMKKVGINGFVKLIELV